MTRNFVLLLIACFLLHWSASGQTWMTKIDSLLDEGVKDYTELPDHSIVFTANHVGGATGKSSFCGKLDQNGNVEYLRGVDWTGLISVKHANGQLFMTAVRPNFLTGLNMFEVLKLNLACDTLKTRPFPDATALFFEINSCPDGGLLATWRGNSYFTKVTKLDADLNEQWTTTLPLQITYSSNHAVYQQSNGDVHWFGDFGGSYAMFRLNALGAVQDSILFRDYLGNSSFHGFGAHRLADGGYLVYGSKTIAANLTPSLIKIDAVGALIWAKDVPNIAVSDVFFHMTVLENGKLLYNSTNSSLNREEYVLLSESGDPEKIHFIERQTPQVSKNLHHPLALSDGGVLIGGSEEQIANADLDSLVFFRWDSLPFVDLTRFIFGKVYVDASLDCSPAPGETPVQNHVIKISNPNYNFYTTTNSLGIFTLLLPADSFYVEVALPGPYFSWCPHSNTIDLTGVGDSLQLDLGLQELVYCPYMTVETTIPVLRRCFDNSASIAYCNLGTVTADSASIEINMEPFLSMTSATVPYQSLGGGQYLFELGNVAPLDCGTIHFTVLADCDSAALGQTHCIETRVFPDSICLPINPLWSGATIELSANCQGDSVRFIMTNVGTGTTVQPIEYIVIEDDVIMYQGNKTLTPQEQLVLSYPAGGQFFRMESDQEVYHPWNFSNPSISLEGCNALATGNFGFWTQFYEDDASPFIDIDCLENVGSWDPNVKYASPEGVGGSHFIERNTDIEYTVHFQNTGTDTAITVVVRDQLSKWLRPESIRMGGASHPHQWTLNGEGALEVTFSNIHLPDSNVNLAGSQGYFSYRISQKPNLPDGTRIENTASIYFDFNAPVITNTTWHTIGENFLSLAAWVPEEAGTTLRVFPNPTSGMAQFSLSGKRASRGTLTLFSANGQRVLTHEFGSSEFSISTGHLPEGMYWFSVHNQDGALAGSGKLIRH